LPTPRYFRIVCILILTNQKYVLGLVVLVASVTAASLASAQPPPPAPKEEPRGFGIIDNSFLVEEAFNQEPGIFQNIFTWTRDADGMWTGVVTQEWPLPNMTHQFSYTIPFSSNATTAGVNDVLLNYRYQLVRESSTRPALAPRISLVLPTGGELEERGLGVYGLQINVPLSKRFGDVYLHANGGWTWSHGVQTASSAGAASVNLTSPQIAGSGVWQMTPMFDLMLEASLLFDEHVVDAAATRSRSVTLSPGFRRGWNFGDRQLVVGAALPISRSEGTTEVAALGYFSYELPFR
jgi:hypothetical protein